MSDTAENASAPVAEVQQMIAIADIEVDEDNRLRRIDPSFAQAIAASMRIDGQLQPIDVCRMINQKGGKPYRLVFGGHRIAGATINGDTHIRAVVRSANALERKSREIAENFFKASLSPLDEARFIAELIANEKARLGIAPDEDGRSLNADVRSKKAKQKQLDDDLCIVHKSLGLQETVAARLGLTQATVSRHLTVNGLERSIVDRVRGLAIADNASALRKLAGLDHDKQVEAVTLMEAGQPANVAFAKAVGKTEKTPDKKRLRAFLDAFGRMGGKEQVAALQLLMLPDGVKLVFEKPKAERMDAGFHAALINVGWLSGKPVPAGDERPDDVVDIEEMLAKGAAE